jgi:signal transduction histidine kinase
MAARLEALVGWQRRVLETENSSYTPELLADLARTLEVPFAWVLHQDDVGKPTLGTFHGFELRDEVQSTLQWPNPMLDNHEVFEFGAPQLTPFVSLHEGAVSGIITRLPAPRLGLCGLYSRVYRVFGAEDKLIFRSAAMLLETLRARDEAQRCEAERDVLDPDDWQAIFRQSPQAAALLSAEGVLLEVNDRFERLFDYRHHSSSGSLSPNFFHWNGETAALGEALRVETVLKGVTLTVRRSGRDPLTLRASFKRLDLAHGAPILALFEDVTAQKQHEAALVSSRLRLAQVRENERVQLAHGLHDGALQTLIGVSYGLAELRRDPDLPDASGGALEAHRLQLLEVARQLRLLISKLRPAGIEEFGLVPSLHNLITQLRRGEPGVRLHYLEKPLPRFPLELELALYRVAQEALVNAIRYAGAENIWLELEVQAQRLHLRVHDDGAGFRVPGDLSSLTDQDHFGLIGIVEQLGQFGGQVTFPLPDTGGFCLEAVVPTPLS